MSVWPVIVFVLALYLLYLTVRHILKIRYFKSEEFLKQKEEVDSTIKEYNEVSEYIKNIPNNNQFVPANNKGEYSHLATFENTSKNKYSRTKNVKTSGATNVYSTSLQVVRNASEDPIKYLCKYFNIKPTQENLNKMQEIGENISRMENTLANLERRQKEIEDSFNPPKFILKHYHKELSEKIGMNLPHIDIEYAQYIFEYISAGGNSSQKSVINLDGETSEAVSQYLLEKIKYKNSAKGQRALMTNKLRNIIKERDDYTCQSCGVSVQEQSLLLLEVDHIIPISKGGTSVPENLQTLCWKCNRSKSNKIL